jgi:hypothetical protein
MEQIVASAEYNYYGIRAHRAAAAVGEVLGNSYVWIDGEPTDVELNGVCTIRVGEGDDLDAIVARIRREYCWDNETIVLVGGYHGEWGEDDGEFIIRNAVVLDIVE